MYWFWVGCVGALLNEASRWAGLHTKAKLPRYLFRLHYWLFTVVFIALGGTLAYFLEPQTAPQALCIGLSAPTILSRLERIFPERLELGASGKEDGSPTRRRLNCLVAHEDVLTAHEIEVPPWKLLKFFGIEKRVVAKDFEKLVGAPRPDQPILFLGGGSDYSTHDLLPGRLTARSFDDSPRFSDLHVENFRQLTNRDLAPANTILFNLIPESLATIRRVGLFGSERRWRRARRTYEEFARQRGLILGDGGSREKLLAALRDGVLDTIVIVAHGETDGIYLADGSKISDAEVEVG
jgi:hypothetical protein